MLGRHTILASNMDDVEVTRGRQLEYTYDVYTNTWELCVGGESCSKIWVGGLEYVGNLPCDGLAPGMSTSDGNYVRVKGTEEMCGWRGSEWRRR